MPWVFAPLPAGYFKITIALTDATPVDMPSTGTAQNSPFGRGRRQRIGCRIAAHSGGYRATAVTSGIHAVRLALQGMSEPSRLCA